MKRYLYSGQGAPLLSSFGQIIRLPLSQLDERTAAPNAKTGITMLFDSLNVQRMLFTEPNCRLYLMADGTPMAQLNNGLDSGTSLRTYTITPAALAAAGIVLTITRPHWFYLDPQNMSAAFDGNSWRADLYIDGVPVPWTGTVGGGGNAALTGQPMAIGGGDTYSQSDFTVFEWFRLNDKGLSIAQITAFANGGRGADTRRMHWLLLLVNHLARFDEASYDSANQWYTPLLGSGVLQAYSSAYKAEYAETNRLFMDGINDVVVTALGNVGTASDNFTYEFDCIPNKYSALATEGQRGPIGFADDITVSSFHAGNPFAAPIYEVTTFLQLQSNGIAFGSQGLEQFSNIVSRTLLSYALTFSQTQFTRIAIRMLNRQPSLFINGQLKYTGVALDASRPCHPWLSMGEGILGVNGRNVGGTYGGWVRNYRLWNVARSDADLAATALPTGNEPDLVLFWPCSRLDPVSGNGINQSTVIVDKKASNPNGEMRNFVLSPAASVFKRRVGRLILH